MKTSANYSYVFKEDNVKVCTFLKKKGHIPYRKKYKKCVHDSVDWL